MEETLQMILSCKTEAEVFRVLVEEGRRLGFDHVAWGMKLPEPIYESRFILHNNYSATWQERYAANNYLSIDPTVSHGLSSVLPILWSDSSMQQAPEFWEEAKAHGLREGIAQSVWDQHRCCSMLTLGRDGLE